jgi:hypothetical protein
MFVHSECFQIEMHTAQMYRVTFCTCALQVLYIFLKFFFLMRAADPPFGAYTGNTSLGMCMFVHSECFQIEMHTAQMYLVTFCTCALQVLYIFLKIFFLMRAADPPFCVLYTSVVAWNA